MLDVQRLMNQAPEIFKNKRLKFFKTMYWLERLETKLNSELSSFNKARIKIVEGAALKNPDGSAVVKEGRCVFSEEKEEDEQITLRINKQISTALEDEIEISIDKLRFVEADLKFKNEKGEESWAVSPDDMSALSPFVDFILEGEERPK